MGTPAQLYSCVCLLFVFVEGYLFLILTIAKAQCRKRAFGGTEEEEEEGREEGRKVG